jgi:hypothetical protein
MSFIPQASVVRAGDTKNDDYDQLNESLLEQVLKELRIMNMHLAFMSDHIITKEDIE